MLVGGSWLMPQLDPHTDIHYGVVPIPTPKAGDQVKVPVGGELGSCRRTPTRRRQEDARLPEQPDVLLEYAKDHSNIPALASVIDKYNEDLPKMAPFVAEMAGAVSRTSVLGTPIPSTRLPTRRPCSPS